MTTFGQILDRNRGIGPGFGVLRIALAVMIMTAHAGWLTSGVLPKHELSTHSITTVFFDWGLLKRPFSDVLVPMFFALSGYLVTGSAVRTRNVGKFLSARLFRIVPALGVEVTLSAIVLGPIFTTYTLHEYFGDFQFYRYFLNIFGFVTFSLPGVFEQNPWAGIVNINLWTLPPEFYCYLFMCTALFTGVVLNRMLFSWGIVICTAVLAVLNAALVVAPGPGVSIEVLVYSFFVGVLFFLWREQVVYSRIVFVISLVLTYLAMLDRGFYILSCVPMTYATLFIGHCKLPEIKLFTYGDYSYGLYLYGFPISQALIASVPAFVGHRFMFAAVAIPTSFAFAAFSWHVIEKPALKLKSRLASMPTRAATARDTTAVTIGRSAP